MPGCPDARMPKADCGLIVIIMPTLSESYKRLIFVPFSFILYKCVVSNIPSTVDGNIVYQVRCKESKEK